MRVTVFEVFWFEAAMSIVSVKIKEIDLFGKRASIPFASRGI
jgi:hypothetical protein